MTYVEQVEFLKNGNFGTMQDCQKEAERILSRELLFDNICKQYNGFSVLKKNAFELSILIIDDEQEDLILDLMCEGEEQGFVNNANVLYVLSKLNLI